MSDTTDFETARDTLFAWVAADASPTLTSTEIEDILDRNQQASTWAAATVYVPGDIILPTVRTGHRYRCEIGGTSGSTEPFTGTSRWPITQGSRVTEGSGSPALTWVEDGPEFKNVYNVRQAAYECWDLKVSRASQFIQTGDLHFEHVYQQCVRQRESFNPMRFA